MFTCPICRKEFTQKGNLKRHLINVHKLDEAKVGELLPSPKKEEKINIRDLHAIAEDVLVALPKRQRLSVKRTKDNQLKKESWLLEFSDLHYGLRVKPVEVGGLAEYNTNIARQRLEYLARTIGRILEYHPNKPSELVIAFLGDMVDNSIMRGNQQASTEFDVITQTMLVSELITDFIVAMSEYFPTIRCYGVYGNHGRLTKSPMDSHPMASFDRLVYYIVADRIKAMKEISFEYTEAQHMLVNVNHWRFWMEHGDSVRSWMGIPFYGSQREKGYITQMLSIFREQAHYVLMGHHHNPADFNGIYINGAFVGGDIFSIGRLRRMSIPVQLLLGVNESHGVVWNRPIQLIDKPTEAHIKIYGEEARNEQESKER